MRKDMDRVVVTPGRHGGIKPRKGKIRSWDDFPTKEGMKRPYGYDTKGQSDLLGPLVGFLKHRIGQKWDDVWSEVCKKNDARSVMGNHVRFHILMMVDWLMIIDGEEWAQGFSGWSAGYSGGPHRWSRITFYENFYIDLKGILRVTVPQSRTKRHWNKPKSNPDVISLNDGTQLRRLNKIWFKIREVERVVDHSSYSGNWTVREIVEKKSLNKSELKVYGLKNGIPIPKAQYRIQQTAGVPPWER